MDAQLNHAPCGFLALSNEGTILSINETLLNTLNYSTNQLIQQHINTILSKSTRVFLQFYFFPLVKLEGHIEEMYISLLKNNGEEIPVLINAVHQNSQIECILIPIKKRSEYESKILLAKKEAEAAFLEKQKAIEELNTALDELEMKQKELVELNRQNQIYKLETKKELELARKIQKLSLTEPIQHKRIHIESFYRASRELSGDSYGFYHIGDDRYGIILLDVMGHGISSALVTMSLHSLSQRVISKGFTPENVILELDNYLHTLFLNNEEDRHYCTAIYLEINTEQKVIHYINAGHPPGLWQEIDGIQLGLHSTNPPIGTFEGIIFKSKRFTYSRGDRLLLYTDGVTEPLDSTYLSRLMENNRSAPLLNLKGKIAQTLDNLVIDNRKSDDQCFILIDLK